MKWEVQAAAISLACLHSKQELDKILTFFMYNARPCQHACPRELGCAARATTGAVSAGAWCTELRPLPPPAA